MGLITFQQNQLIIEQGQTVNQLMIITKGEVNAVYHSDSYLMGKGDVIGLFDLGNNFYTYQYTADTEVTLISYPCSDLKDLIKIIHSNADIGGLLAVSLTKTICHIIDNYIMLRYETDNLYHYLLDCYSEYKSLCLKYAVSAKDLPMDHIAPLKEDDDVKPWLVNYYESMKDFDSELTRHLFVEHQDYLIGYLLKASTDIQEILSCSSILEEYQSDVATVLLNTNHLDLFDLYSSLICKLIHNKVDTMSLSAAISKLIIQMEGRASIDPQLYEARMNEYRSLIQQAETDQIQEVPADSKTVAVSAALDHSLDIITKYSDCPSETAEAFRQAVYEYKDIVDKTATTDFMIALRKKITKLFYEIYTSAFQISLSDPHVPTVLMMFFTFGYVDKELAGAESASFMYDIVKSQISVPDKNIYTLYDWLKLIYDGKKEPSRNEFDNDFNQYVHELRINNKITDVVAKKMLTDNAEKVMYEIRNMFPLVNKITHGRISSYCPVFSEHNMFKSPDQQIVKPDVVYEALQNIKSIDYTSFYRETLYTDMENGIPKETIQVDIMPDIILMPNVGMRGVMWQEIEGKRRTTPARFMLPILYPESVQQLLTKVVGEYRWEMCKRIQGARWNDVSDLSLTSEYFDYIQFYRKNSDLSPDIKEKIKQMLQKTKGSYRETFVRDYISWITLEGKGSPVLNKVSRKIMFTYCPFSKEIRNRLKTNPLYKDYLDRYDIKKAQYLHHLDNVCAKLINSGKQVPNELERQREMVER